MGVDMSIVSFDKPLGDYIEIVLARALDERIRRQKVASGGATTALLIYMLDSGEIDGVVAAKKVRGLVAELVIARNREEVLQAAGNRWSVLPYTTKLKEALQHGDVEKVALVGLPCQAQFLWQMRMFPLLETDFVNKIHMIISLFCIGTFVSEAFVDILKLRYGLDPERVSSIGLEGNRLRIVYDSEEKVIPLQEVIPYIQTGCLVCPDYTGVLADLSSGLSENYPGYTVFIIRSECAREAVYGAKDRGYLEVRKAGADVIDEIETKARGKIVRATRYMSLLL